MIVSILSWLRLKYLEVADRQASQADDRVWETAIADGLDDETW
jgi:hypothetical protein